ncbi:hypothetical protein KC323_g121 [Hortaea werneckii]|nr:hypothetical protein KC323_g121 [Hortaea werneckii]KAI7360250.1 hypothetical protein KC320_g60 [Hortaea werneckii]
MSSDHCPQRTLRGGLLYLGGRNDEDDGFLLGRTSIQSVVDTTIDPSSHFIGRLRQNNALNPNRHKTFTIEGHVKIQYCYLKKWLQHRLVGEKIKIDLAEFRTPLRATRLLPQRTLILILLVAILVQAYGVLGLVKQAFLLFPILRLTVTAILLPVDVAFAPAAGMEVGSAGPESPCVVRRRHSQRHLYQS